MTEQVATTTFASTKVRILDAALAEFASRGFEAASTNVIAERANVAKGLLFHHFDSKEGLFEALFERETRKLSELVVDALGGDETDVFERLSKLSAKKLELTAKEPLTADFLVSAVLEAPPGVRPRIAERQAQMMREAWPKLVSGVDATKLKPGVSVDEAIETVTIFAEGLERQLSERIKTSELGVTEIGARVWHHFTRLRDGLYAA